MKKLFAIYLLMALGINCFAQDSSPVPLNEAIRNAMQYLTTRIAPDSKVVVLNFAAPTEQLSNYIIEDLSDYIVNSRTLTVVDRRSLDVLRQEINFNMSGEVNDATAQRIGQLLGAQSIISGYISPLGSNYRFRVQAIEVETAALQGGQTITVIEDATLAALLGNRYIAPRPPFTQKFAVGAQAGTLYGLGANFDYGDGDAYSVGIGNFGFLASLYGSYAVNSFFRVQLGINIAINDINMKYDYEDEYPERYKYNSLDIPLLANFYFNPSSNVLFRLGIGPYLSLPIGDLEYKNWDNYSSTYSIENSINFGLLGGFGFGYRIGNGNIVLDLRYLSDLQPTEPLYLFRRGLTILAGYEYWF